MKNLLIAIIIMVLFIPGICLAEAPPVRIGLSMCLTGKEAKVGKMQEQAFRLWESDVNRSGGLLGRKVVLTIYDDQGSEELAKALYTKMVEKEKMDFLFAPYSSALTMAILPIAEKHGYPILASGAGADSLFKKNYRYLFGIFPPASIYSLGFLEMLSTQGYKKVAIIGSGEPFGDNIADGAAKWAERLGMKIVLRETIGKGVETLDQIAARAKAAGAQGVLMCGHFTRSVAMRKAMKNIKWYPAAYWSSAGPDLPEYYKLLGKDAENTFSSTQWQYYDKLPYPGSREFYKGFVARYKTEPSYHAATAYTAGILLHSAVRQTGSLDRARIRGTLAVMDVMTPLGRYGVDKTGLQIRYFHLVTQWINGRKEVVWPVDLRTAKPRFRQVNK